MQLVEPCSIRSPADELKGFYEQDRDDAGHWSGSRDRAPSDHPKAKAASSPSGAMTAPGAWTDSRAARR